MSEANERLFDSREDMHPKEFGNDRDGAPRWVWFAVAVLATVSVLGLGVGWNATTQAKRAEQALATQSGQNKLVGQDLQALRQGIQALKKGRKEDARTMQLMAAEIDRLCSLDIHFKHVDATFKALGLE